ncbi:MAG: hypothetical protein EA416_08710 [Trueperaceae bacterium]|nr:MAG: hypothetical protein EA416_08710 [Trueperaceae bacterium]
MSLPRPIGQDAALVALRQLAAGGARTFLFAGPDGVGRRVAARWFAAYLNCRTGLDEPCGACAPCLTWRDVDDGMVSLQDYREVAAPATTRDGRPTRRRVIGIDQLVDRPDGDPDPLGPWLARAPTERVRVGVVEAAEELGEAAANAFLKTLEEPPTRAVIVLVAPGPDALLPTVASRCTVVRFAPVTPDAATWRRHHPHPALRLGRPARLRDDETTDAARRAVTAFTAALPTSLGATFAALRDLQDAWEADAELVPGLLRESARARGAVVYAACDAALEAVETATAQYVHRALTLKRFALTLRSVWGDADPR